MALVTCKECGRSVSDKAAVCPNCGAPIEKMVKCEECGQEMAADAAVCPNCGCPNTQRSSSSGAKPHAQPSRPATDDDEMKKRVQRFLVQNRKFLPQEKVEEVRDKLMTLNENQLQNVECMVFKDPTMMLVISVLVGEFGVDRFILGDTTNGVLKLVLTLCCGVGLIWWLIDIFQVNGMTLKYNYKLFEDTLSYV